MGVEIERKFLADGAIVHGRAGGRVMVQGYVAQQEGTAVRVRIAGDQAWLTIKGPSSGATRVEVEVEVPVEEARSLLPLCKGGLIEKTRWEIPWEGHTWEVDVFDGDNAGLVVAEVELTSEDEAFERPPWVGAEVTDDGRYANAALATHPYRAWEAGA